jgi:hypothetical protein
MLQGKEDKGHPDTNKGKESRNGQQPGIIE